jgi:hypothetical protein
MPSVKDLPRKTNNSTIVPVMSDIPLSPQHILNYVRDDLILRTNGKCIMAEKQKVNKTKAVREYLRANQRVVGGDQGGRRLEEVQGLARSHGGSASGRHQVLTYGSLFK